MKELIKNYTFDKVAKTVTFTDLAAIDLERILVITDVTNNITIYQFNSAALKGTVATNVLTLNYNTNTGSFNNSDKLQIWYQAAGPLKVGHGSKNVTTAGTAVALATTTACKSVAIQAKPANTGNIYIGGSGISSASGVVLAAGDSVTLDVGDLASIFLDSSVSGEGVTFTYTA